MDDLRKQMLEEAEQDLNRKDLEQIKQRSRPKTAHPLDSQSSKMSTPPPKKKFKMLKELARLNQELRVQKPYSPNAHDKLKELES